MKRMTMAVTAALLLGPLLFAGELPSHPKDIDYPELTWSPPDPFAHRDEPDEGASPILYLVRDDVIPLTEVTVTFRGGSAEDPDGKEGLGRMAGSLLLRGGTAKETGDEIVRRFEAGGGRISISVGREYVTATAQVLSTDLDDALDTLAEVLFAPAFRDEQTDRYRAERKDAFRRRGDRIGRVTVREFRRLVLGEGHATAREETPKTLAGISKADMEHWQCVWIDAGKLVITVAGAVPDPAAVKRKVFALFAPRDPDHVVEPRIADVPAGAEKTRVHVIHRLGATQGNVRIGSALDIARGHPDWMALQVMNYVLGGSGFPSRITKRVRSDEGLAYSVGARINATDRYGGTYAVGFQTRSAMVPFAIGLVMEELRLMRESGVTDDELSRAKRAMVERFPARFDTVEATASAFADLESAGLPPDWLDTYREEVEAITKEDVLRVAKKYLIDPEGCVVLVVGDRKAIEAGDPTGAHPERLADFGEVVE